MTDERGCAVEVRLFWTCVTALCVRHTFAHFFQSFTTWTQHFFILHILITGSRFWKKIRYHIKLLKNVRYNTLHVKNEHQKDDYKITALNRIFNSCNERDEWGNPKLRFFRGSTYKVIKLGSFKEQYPFMYGHSSWLTIHSHCNILI